MADEVLNQNQESNQNIIKRLKAENAELKDRIHDLEAQAKPENVRSDVPYEVTVGRDDGLGYISKLVREVDLGNMGMQDARKAIGAWFEKLPNRNLATGEGRIRMKRLKSIVDAFYEEYMTVTSQV